MINCLFIFILVAGVPYMLNITASNIYGYGDTYSYMFFTNQLSKEADSME